MTPVLDIVIPHYKEPISVVKRMLQMIDCQRCVNFSSFTVTIVQDGFFPENNAFVDYVDEHNFNYDIRRIVIDHAGVSAARNAGIENTSAPWIMFCDCDDTFSSVYSLKQIMDILLGEKANDYDMMWTKFYIEDEINGEVQIRTSIQNNVFVHGKIFRRSFLDDNHIRFAPELYFSEDSAFCADVDMAIDHAQIGTITSSGTGCLYAWCYSKTSQTTNPENKERNILGLFLRHRYVIEQFRKHGDMFNFRAMIARTITDYYYQLTHPEHSGAFRQQLHDDFDDFFRQYGNDFRKVNDDVLYKCLSATLNESKKRRDFHEPSVTFRQWSDQTIPRERNNHV